MFKCSMGIRFGRWVLDRTNHQMSGPSLFLRISLMSAGLVSAAAVIGAEQSHNRWNIDLALLVLLEYAIGYALFRSRSPLAIGFIVSISGLMGAASACLTGLFGVLSFWGPMHRDDWLLFVLLVIPLILNIALLVSAIRYNKRCAQTWDVDGFILGAVIPIPVAGVFGVVLRAIKIF